MKKNLYIFIGNKLISVDTVLPLVYELKKLNKINKIKFITQDTLTFKGIQKNYIIFDAIEKVGKLIFIGNKFKIYRDKRATLPQRIISFVNKNIRKILLLPFFLNLIIQSKFNKLIIFHFKLFDLSPWKIVKYFNKNNIYKLDKSWGNNKELEVAISLEGKKLKNISNACPEGNIIAFHKDSLLLKKKNAINKKFLLAPTSNYTAWVNFLKKNYNRYINKELSKYKIDINQDIITIMLGSFAPLGFLKNENTAIYCLKETLSVLNKLNLELPILIKPHIVSEEEIYNTIIKSFKNKKFIITQLHPGILALKSKVFISNSYSTTMSTANLLSVPTVEYTDYSKEMLKITKNKSIRPEYIDFFINRDKDKLKKTVLKCLKYRKKKLKTNSPKSALLNEIINTN
tara:strand:+ start:1622 stop:2824 length:1203 start_codon:yes stop_codon:yes gene_type:complete